MRKDEIFIQVLDKIAMAMMFTVLPFAVIYLITILTMHFMGVWF